MPLRLVVAHAEFNRKDLKKFKDPLFESDYIEFAVYMLRDGQCILTVTAQPLEVCGSIRGALDTADIRYGKNVAKALKECFVDNLTTKDADRIKYILEKLPERTPDSYIHKGENNAHK